MLDHDIWILVSNANFINQEEDHHEIEGKTLLGLD
jgi:hypothetical protein